MSLDFGQHRVIFIMGDAEAGGRTDPETPLVGHSIEGILLDCCRSELKANVLIVGHHGSKTSSRATFLNAVGAKQFVISAGPMKYGSLVLPDAPIVQALQGRGTLFRTDLNDQTCGQIPAKIGPVYFPPAVSISVWTQCGASMMSLISRLSKR